MNSFHFDHLERCQVAHYALYTPVNNAANIKERIISAAKAEGDVGDRERDDINFAFIDATLVRATCYQ